MKVEYWQSKKNGKWYFHRKARNGKITDPSQGYATASNARRAIRTRWPNLTAGQLVKGTTR